MKTFSLRPVSGSDQRRPCAAVVDDRACRTRAVFLLWPSCSHDEADWPTAQSCGAHLARVVKAASGRCSGHQGGNVVRVRPL